MVATSIRDFVPITSESLDKSTLNTELSEWIWNSWYSPQKTGPAFSYSVHSTPYQSFWASQNPEAVHGLSSPIIQPSTKPCHCSPYTFLQVHALLSMPTLLSSSYQHFLPRLLQWPFLQVSTVHSHLLWQPERSLKYFNGSPLLLRWRQKLSIWLSFLASPCTRSLPCPILICFLKPCLVSLCGILAQTTLLLPPFHLVNSSSSFIISAKYLLRLYYDFQEASWLLGLCQFLPE